MGRTISIDEAKKYSLKLLSGREYGNWENKGFNLTDTAVKACIELVHVDMIRPVTGSRIAPSGNQFDLYADSAWHALCALLFQEIYSRINRGSYQNAIINIEKSFGK